MIRLAIGPDDPTWDAQCPPLELTGAPAQPPFRGAALHAGPPQADGVADQVEISLEGDPGALRQGILSLQHRLGLLSEDHLPLYLLAQTGAGEPTWRSRLLAGRLEILRGSPALGSAVIGLALQRAAWWEGPELPLALSGRGQPVTSAGIWTYNHDDGQHGNAVDLAPGAIPGELPTPARIQLTNAAGNSGANGTVWIALNQRVPPDAPPPHWLEAEAAGGGDWVDDAAASGGAYKRFTWSGAAETRIAEWTLDGAWLCQSTGPDLLALLRFAGAPAYTDLWLQLRLRQNSATLWEGPWSLVRPPAEVQELGGVRLPALAGVVSPLQPYALALYARRAAGGSSQAALDWLALAPLDGWRKIASRGTGWSTAETLTDDSAANLAYASLLRAHRSDFIAYGEPLLLCPGPLGHRILFIHQRQDTAAAEPLRSYLVQAWARPRIAQLR